MAMKLFNFVFGRKQNVLSFPKNPLSFMTFYLNLRQHLEKKLFSFMCEFENMVIRDISPPRRPPGLLFRPHVLLCGVTLPLYPLHAAYIVRCVRQACTTSCVNS